MEAGPHQQIIQTPLVTLTPRGIVFLLVASPFFTFLLLPHLFVTSGALVIIVYAHCGTPIVIVNYRPGQSGFTLLRCRVSF